MSHSPSASSEETTTQAQQSQATQGRAFPRSAGVIPPKLVEQADVPYPTNGEGDAVVVVQVTVNADGRVRTASAQSGAQPFADAAVESVKTWHFEPATRDGKPVAAIIRLEVAFHAPVLRDVESEEPSTVAAPTQTQNQKTGTPGDSSTTAAKPQQPIEVTVAGEKRAPMVASLTRTEVRQIPGTFGDPFRAVEILPGVTPLLSGLPYFYVRGAPPGNVGYYLDGIRVPYLYHVAVGPSIVHPGMVDRVDLYSGGYPASYGRFAGGIAAAETTKPNPTWRGEANVRLYDAGAMVEGGFDRGKGTVLLGGRYSYTAALISLAAKDVKIDYRDYQARVSYELTPKDQISVVGFGAYDLIASKSGGISTVVFGTEFYRGELRWDRTIGNDGHLRTAFTLGYDQSSVGGMVNAQNRMVGIRTDFQKPLGRNMNLRVGVDGLLESYRATNVPYEDPDDPEAGFVQRLFPPRKDSVLGAYGEIGIQVQPRFYVTPGLRVDYFTSGNATAVGIDPRLSAKLKLSDKFAIVHAYGIAHQPPSFVLPIPGFALGSLAKGLQTSYQTSAGIEWGLAKGTVLTSSLFHNIFTNLTDALSVPEGLEQSDDVNQRTRGRSYGFELFLHRKLTQNLGGFLSYTLSRSTRRLGNDEFPAAFDRRHVLNTALAYNLGRNWRAGTRLTLYTGAPKQVQTNPVPTNTEAPTAVTPNNPRVSNPPRDPAFYRIDVRLEKEWRYGKTTHLSFVAEVLNVTAHKEIYQGTEIGPIFVPSLGLEGGF
ncbi:MAG: TonB family protein [Myxococcales bacterium]